MHGDCIIIHDVPCEKQLVVESLSYIHQKHEKPTTPVKKVMREFDRGTRGWFLRKVVLGHGGGGGVQLWSKPLILAPNTPNNSIIGHENGQGNVKNAELLCHWAYIGLVWIIFRI